MRPLRQAQAQEGSSIAHWAFEGSNWEAKEESEGVGTVNFPQN